jgi:hypothetical protein
MSSGLAEDPVKEILDNPVDDLPQDKVHHGAGHKPGQARGRPCPLLHSLLSMLCLPHGGLCLPLLHKHFELAKRLHVDILPKELPVQGNQPFMRRQEAREEAQGLLKARPPEIWNREGHGPDCLRPDTKMLTGKIEPAG